jgi:hypothetical protein
MSAMRMAQRVVQERRRLAIRLDAREGAREPTEQRLAFQPRQQLADAQMNAGAKTDVAGGWAVDVVAVRIGPFARVAVGGAKQHQHFLALGDCRAADLDLSRSGAENVCTGVSSLTASSKSARALDGSARSAPN